MDRYKEYLRSKHWQKVRNVALERAGHRCQTCGDNTLLNVHHQTYERLGQELPEDLMVLCAGCHEKKHNLPESFWVGQHRYRRVFFEYYRGPPWKCCFCARPITLHTQPGHRENLLVHHLDENPKNDDISNLVPAHWGCHSTYTGLSRSEASRAKSSVSAKVAYSKGLITGLSKGQQWSDGQRAKVAGSLRRAYAEGRKTNPMDNPVARAKASASLKGRSVWNKGKKLSPQRRAALIEVHNRPEVRAKHAAAARNRPPEVYAKMKATAQARPTLTCSYCGRQVKGKGPLATHLKVCALKERD